MFNLSLRFSFAAPPRLVRGVQQLVMTLSEPLETIQNHLNQFKTSCRRPRRKIVLNWLWMVLKVSWRVVAAYAQRRDGRRSQNGTYNRIEANLFELVLNWFKWF